MITIQDEVWIGANAVILAGVCIGKHSVIAAGSIVTKDVPPYTVAGGNPARVLKSFNPETKQWERKV
jgi:acetyltransferase-like isoleucine patch superfamily enzyme